MTVSGRLSAAGVAVAFLMVVTPGRPMAQSVSYTYDPLGRVSTATYPNGVTVAYTYDAAGNRTQVVRNTTPPPPPPPPPLTVTANPTSWTLTPTTTPPPVVCTAYGGTAPYSYHWQFVSGDNLTEVVDPASSAGVWFRPVATATARLSTWRCRVTDAASATANSANVTVSIRTN